MSKRSLKLALAASGLALTRLAQAQPASNASGVVTGQIATLLVAMAVVLALIGAAAYLLKRYSLRGGASGGALRVVAAAAVGPRERVVVVEIGGTWLVLGVAPGAVRSLHRMPRLAEKPEVPAQTGAQRPFASWLKERLERRR